jgi:hypothetical protein
MLTRGRLSTGLPGRRLLRTGRLSTGMSGRRLLRTGRLSTGPLGRRLLRTGRLTKGLLGAGLLITVGLLAGCSTPPTTFRPAGVTTPDGTGSPASPAHHTAGHGAIGALNWPPFGGNVHIFMPGWLPADRGEAPAVVAAKNFLLAFLYAEYRGNQDDRWTRYVSGDVLGALKANLSEPNVTSESFTGAINFSHLRAYPDPTTTGAIDVSECFDNSGSHNTSLATGKIIPDRIPADQHYYRNTDVMARRNGQWNVVSVYPVVYYPQAPECKP